MRPRLVAGFVIVLAYVAGVLSAGAISGTQAQAPSRFVHIGTDGPFRVWRDTKTDQCFIVTTPYFAMLSVGPC